MSMGRVTITQQQLDGQLLAVEWETLGAVDRYRALYFAARLGRQCAVAAADPDFLPCQDYYIDRLCDALESWGVEFSGFPEGRLPLGPRLTAFREGWNEGLKTLGFRPALSLTRGKGCK